MNIDPSTRLGPRWYRQSEHPSLTDRTRSRIKYLESDEALVQEAEAAVRAHWEKNPPGSPEHPWLVPAMIEGIGPGRLQSIFEEVFARSEREADRRADSARSFLRDLGIFAVARAIAVAGHPALVETQRVLAKKKDTEASNPALRVVQHLLPEEWKKRAGEMIASATHHRLVGALPAERDSDSPRSGKIHSRYTCDADRISDVPLLPTVAPSGENLAFAAVVVAWFACDFIGAELFRDRWNIRRSGHGIELVGHADARPSEPIVGFAVVGVDSYGMFSAGLGPSEEAPLVLGIELTSLPPGMRHAIRNFLASEFPFYADPRGSRRSRGRFRAMYNGANRLVDLVVLARTEIESLAAALDPAAREAYEKFLDAC